MRIFATTLPILITALHVGGHAQTPLLRSKDAAWPPQLKFTTTDQRYDGIFHSSSEATLKEQRRRSKWLHLLDSASSTNKRLSEVELSHQRRRERLQIRSREYFASERPNSPVKISRLPEKNQWVERKRQLQQQAMNETVPNCQNSTDCNVDVSKAMNACENDAAILETDEDKKFECSCARNSMSGVTMNCKSQCGNYCNNKATRRMRAGDICGRKEYDHVYGMEGNILHRVDHFLYTKGVDNQLSVVQHNCSGDSMDDLVCHGCTVNDGLAQTCRTCQLIDCPNGSRAPLMDCSNIEHNSTFDLCNPESIPARDGIFSKLSSAGFERCEDQSPGNDLCNDNAQAVVLDGTTILGSTEQAMVDNFEPCNDSSPSPGLWYRVEGTGTGIAVSTCGSVTTFDTQISVYTGECGELQCILFNDDATHDECEFGQSQIGFFGTEGTIYHIKIHGYGTSTGIFQLEFREADLAQDECVAMKSRIVSPVSFEEGLECICQPKDDGSRSLRCTDTCEFCNDNNTVCATKTIAATFHRQSTTYSTTNTFSYTKGLDHVVKIHNINCTTESCGGCNATVDGTMCNLCDIQNCGGEDSVQTGMVIDCKNVDPQAVFDECNDTTSESGVLQILSKYNFQECQQDPVIACNILAEQTMAASWERRTKCSCEADSEDSASLTCYDDNCRFCNDEGTICSNTTYGGIVTGKSPGLAKEFRQYEYVIGRSEVLRFEDDVEDCDFYIDEKLCNSCSKVLCHGDIEEDEGISVDCSNIYPDAILNECSTSQPVGPDGVLMAFSKYEFKQCIEGEDPLDTCLRMKQYEETEGFERNTTCHCSSNSISGEHILSCSDSGCLFCNHPATVCATNTYGYRIGRFGEPLLYFEGYHYNDNIAGRNDQVLVEYVNDQCKVRIDDQECSDCQFILCPDGAHGRFFHDIIVDCENIETGASFDLCDQDLGDTGVLQVTSNDEFRECIIPTLPKDSCMSEAALREGQIDGVSCNCTANDRGGFDLLCVEAGCLYCNRNKQMCGYDTSVTVFNALGSQIESGSGFKFVSGIDGHLLFQFLDRTSDPGDCVVSFNNEKCSSCEIYECDSDSRGLRINCQNVLGGSMVDECNFDEVSGFLEYLSPQSFLHCTPTMDPMEFCEEQKELTESSKSEGKETKCSCLEDSSGELQMSCTDETCLYCSADASVCKMNALYGGTISKFGFFTSSVEVSQYVQGRQERIAIEKTPEGSCSVSIDEEICSNCQAVVCDDDSIGFNIDCNNVVEGAMYDHCQTSGDGGIFELLSDKSFEVCLAYNGEVQDLFLDKLGTSRGSKSRGLAGVGIALICLGVISTMLL